MFDNTVTVDTATATALEYALINVINGKSTRKVAGTHPDEPLTMTIGHQIVNRKGVTAQRHLVRFDEANFVNVGESIPLLKHSAQLVIDHEQGLTLAEIKENLSRLITFMAISGAIDKILNGEP
jgi:hypothetical protein